MRIAIVNDLSLAVESLRRVLPQAPQHQIAWTANDGAEAVHRCVSDRPDLILMDLVMPVMDGVKATRRIMRETPCALLVTATVTGNSSRLFDALGAGALDAINTPVPGRPRVEAWWADRDIVGASGERRGATGEPRDYANQREGGWAIAHVSDGGSRDALQAQEPNAACPEWRHPEPVAQTGIPLTTLRFSKMKTRPRDWAESFRSQQPHH